MLFERFSKDADWLQAMGVAVPDPAAFDRAGARMQRAKLLVFSRWCQVMFRFEKALYDNPDQDLNTLWWDLVERYQMVNRPEGRNAPDYASKIHIVSAPAYYHNYLMGELFADQVLHAIARDVLNGVDPSKASFVGKQGRRRLPQDPGLRARPLARLERPDPARDRRRPERQGVRRRDRRESDRNERLHRALRSRDATVRQYLARTGWRLWASPGS